ncbi:NAD(P)H-dependent oxidoreductase [Streptomyces sp. NBC_01239]|uniref:NAD(P)H-dependent oxidoreductase n=1 Tax=Streptomyces sp. NBC_01239 TaxID=2903792 RepID=UPI00224F7537|nr:NAD(P)H-dependent oxidoreductase [Streptomyces sp. NBC_01239]MCX4816477.1 NAD(P)H-dependent oxidoreductase [Streptomyces sp. NBC_01239]
MTEPMTDRPLVQVLIASTRPNRAGEPTAQWVAEQAVASGAFDIEIVDLAKFDLPMFAERAHPSERNYQMPSTRTFSEVIDRAAAYVFVMPEYNHSYNAALKNALDHLFWEWHGKPVLLISYGGVAAGARAATALGPVLIALQLRVVGFVPIPFIDKHIHPHDGRRVFRPTEPVEHGLTKALEALHRAMQPRKV